MTRYWAALGARHAMVPAILIVAGTFGAAALGIAAWPDEAAFEAQATPLHPQLAPLRIRCETCGVIEGIRFSAATPTAAEFYEFAVRLPDGSLRRSSDPQPGRWKVGDQMQLIGGERTWSQSGPADER